MSDTINDLLVLSKLVYASAKIYVWAFNKKGVLINSNCPDQKTLVEIYGTNRYKHKVLEFINKKAAPCVLGSNLGLSWGLVTAKEVPSDDGQPYAFLIGPVFFDKVADSDIYEFLSSPDYEHRDKAWHQKAFRTISGCTVTDISAFNQEVLKFHYLASESYDEVHVSYRLSKPEAEFFSVPTSDEYLRLYANEQLLLNMIRNGEINYTTLSQETIRQILNTIICGASTITRAKNITCSFLILVSRAAIDGNVNVAESYSMVETYLPAIETAGDPAELSDIAVRVFDKYLNKVNEVKENPHYSPLVQKTSEYIEQHLGSKILARDIAEHLGYNEYYLTKRFKEETGCYINEYIKQLKIKRAKNILETTDMKIQEISEFLGFSTCNYFCTCFRNVTGISPQEYRLQSQNTKQYL